ncbi:MAG TPA: hypothetical protein VG713_09075, partial [Pirellulales bacterium]|nr:hypothetical protein [Pirellulales bacterium]
MQLKHRWVVVAVLILGVARARADTVTTSITFDHQQVPYSGNLTIGSGTSPELRLQNGATTSGIATVVAGNGANQTGSLRIISSTFSGGDTYLGYQQGSNGTATIGGTNAAMNLGTGTLFVGYAGTGNLWINSGGQVNDGFGYVNTTTSAAVVVGSGSQWNSSYSLNVASGALTVAQGGTANSANGIVGMFPGGNGTAVVANAGSTLSITNRLDIGFSNSNGGATGTLFVQDRGVANAAGLSTLGTDAGSTGSAFITTSGTWNVGQILAVGLYGNGALTINSGGVVNGGNNAFVGDNAGSSGSASITGTGSQWNLTGQSLSVGYFGTGALTVAGGGHVNSGTGGLGSGNGVNGTALVTGAGSSWNAGSTMWVGYSGHGALTIGQGGVVTNGTGYVGFDSTGVGTVNVWDSGSVWTTSNDLYIGGQTGGVGTVSVGWGGLVAVG